MVWGKASWKLEWGSILKERTMLLIYQRFLFISIKVRRIIFLWMQQFGCLESCHSRCARVSLFDKMISSFPSWLKTENPDIATWTGRDGQVTISCNRRGKQAHWSVVASIAFICHSKLFILPKVGFFNEGQ